MTRVLLLGAAGLVGTDLVRTAPGSIDLIKAVREAVDVTQAESLDRAIGELRPHVVLNASGYTNVDRAEKEQDTATSVNGVAPGLIGLAAAKVGAAVIHYSTDYIFDGTPGQALPEDTAPHPINHYGQSKLDGELALAASGARHVIIRTQWVFGVNGRSFPRTMWERAKRGDATRVVNDQVGRPTYSHDLATATWMLAQRLARKDSGLPSVLHVTNHGTTTWYDFARPIFRAAGAEQLLTPCSSAEFPTPARRPAWSVLDTSRFESIAGGTLPPWESALDRFLAELREEA